MGMTPTDHLNKLRARAAELEYHNENLDGPWYDEPFTKELRQEMIDTKQALISAMEKLEEIEYRGMNPDQWHSKLAKQTLADMCEILGEEK